MAGAKPKTPEQIRADMKKLIAAHRKYYKAWERQLVKKIEARSNQKQSERSDDQ